MFGQIDEIKNLAFKYSKQQLGRMVQMGMIDPQKAMMAGMMRDRVSKEDNKPPTTTVAQDVLGEAPQMQQPAQPQQMGMPQAPAPQAPTQMAATGGITSLPVHEQDYAGGGIVAFADGGDTDDGVAHFDQGGFNFPAGSLFGMYERRPTAGGVAMDELQALDAQIAQTPPGPMRDRMIQTREFTAAKAAKANTQQFPTGIIATPEGQQAQQTTGAITNPFNTPADNTPAVPALGADKASPASSTPTLPRLPALNRPSGDIKVEPFSAPAAKDLKDIRSEKENYYKELGIDPDVYSKMIEKEEGKRGEFSKRKEEAKGEFLMNLGLGIATSKRGREAEGASEGATKGLASYKESMKDVRAAEEKLDDRINNFRLADQQAKKTGADSDIAKRDSMLDKVEAAKNETIKAKNTAAAESAKVQANIYGTETAANTARYVAQVHANTQKEMNTLVKQGQLDAKVAQVLLTAEKNFMEANATSFIGKPDELARAARAHAIEAAKVYLPGSTAASSSMAAAPAPTADIYKNKYGITPTKG